MATAARLLNVVKVGDQSLTVVMTTTRKLGIILWSSSLIYKTLSCRAIYLSALKSYKITLSYTVIVPYSRVLSYIPIYSVYRDNILAKSCETKEKLESLLL